MTSYNAEQNERQPKGKETRKESTKKGILLFSGTKYRSGLFIIIE